jgi:hypothetical protein
MEPIPVNHIYVVGKEMQTIDARNSGWAYQKIGRMRVAAKPFEATLKVIPKRGGRYISLYHEETGYTYKMHPAEVRQMMVKGAKIEGGVVSGVWGFSRVSTSVTLRWLREIPQRVSLVEHMVKIARQAREEQIRIVKDYFGPLYNPVFHDDGTATLTDGRLKMTTRPVLQVEPEVESEWVTEVTIEVKPAWNGTGGAKPEKYLVQLGQLGGSLTDALIRMRGAY